MSGGYSYSTLSSSVGQEPRDRKVCPHCSAVYNTSSAVDPYRRSSTCSTHRPSIADTSPHNSQPHIAPPQRTPSPPQAKPRAENDRYKSLSSGLTLKRSQKEKQDEKAKTNVEPTAPTPTKKWRTITPGRTQLCNKNLARRGREARSSGESRPTLPCLNIEDALSSSQNVRVTSSSRNGSREHRTSRDSVEIRSDGYGSNDMHSTRHSLESARSNRSRKSKKTSGWSCF